MAVQLLSRGCTGIGCRCTHNTGLVPERKIDDYSSSQAILLVGEGDFSFSSALANAFGHAVNLVATSLDSKEEVLSKYEWATVTLLNLLNRGAAVFNNIDARNLADHPTIGRWLFDRIVWNLPHAGFFAKSECDETVIEQHKTLLEAFFCSAAKLLILGGEIHVSHQSHGPYKKWELEKLAQSVGLHLRESVPFFPANYPGYCNRRGAGKAASDSFHLGTAKMYKFVKNKHAQVFSQPVFSIGAGNVKLNPVVHLQRNLWKLSSAPNHPRDQEVVNLTAGRCLATLDAMSGGGLLDSESWERKMAETNYKSLETWKKVKALESQTLETWKKIKDLEIQTLLTKLSAESSMGSSVGTMERYFWTQGHPASSAIPATQPLVQFTRRSERWAQVQPHPLGPVSGYSLHSIPQVSWNNLELRSHLTTSGDVSSQFPMPAAVTGHGILDPARCAHARNVQPSYPDAVASARNVELISHNSAARDLQLSAQPVIPRQSLLVVARYAHARNVELSSPGAVPGQGLLNAARYAHARNVELNSIIGSGLGAAPDWLTPSLPNQSRELTQPLHVMHYR